MPRLDGKVVLLTGAAAGIGKQIALLFAEEGAKLALCDINAEGLEATRVLCEQRGADTLAARVDITRADQISTFVGAVAQRFATIDVLINNANHQPPRTPFLDQDRTELQKGFDVGVLAHWTFMKECYPHLKGGSGSVINFVSAAYKLGLEGFAAFAPDKAAIRSLAMVVAREWGKDGIRVNTVAPSALTDSIENTLTPQYAEWIKQQLSANPFGRYGEPYGDIAPAVLFLATDDSRWITGQNLNVEGGSTMFA